MAEDKVRVAVVGGGRTGTPLLENLLKRPFVEVVGVADVNPDSPGARMAQGAGVMFTTDYMDLARKGTEIDLLFELSGDPEVKPRLKAEYQAQGNRHTIIVHDLLARLMISIISGAEELVQTYHPHDDGVG